MRRRLLFAAPVVLLFGCATPSPPPASQPTVVFFTADSASLDMNAQKVVSDMAAAAKAQPGAVVHVRGFAAPDTGSPEYNGSLARTRALAVADGLAGAGVPSARIRVETRGAVAFDLWPRESRRVEVVIGG